MYMNNKTTGLKSIALELKLSINTVSRALRDCDDISEATKEKVRKKAFELGYMPNNITQFIKKYNKPLVAIVVNSFNNTYFSIVMQKLSEVFEKENCDFTVIYTLKKKLDLEVIKQCISQRVDGIITLIEVEDDAIVNAKLNNMPIVALGRNIDKDYIDSIYNDDEKVGKLIGDYFLQKPIDKFIYIKMTNVECSKRRQNSLIDYMKKINPNNDIVVLEEKQVDSKLYDLLENGYMGIFCFNDEVAYHLLENIKTIDKNYKERYPLLSVVGFDNLASQISGFKDITSISYDYDKLCKTAVMLIKERFAGRIERKSIKFNISLHVGEE